MAAQVLCRLDAFPGVHGDEAWVGLFARRLADLGLYTPHEMNTYTGPLYAWLVKLSFARFGTGVWALRLPGAALNIAAWALLAGVAARAGGARSALAWCLFAAASPIVTLKSRVAWEVYALQPFLAGAVLWAAVTLASGPSRAAALLLGASSLLGVQNHFIFLSLPLALAGAAAVLHARRPDGRWTPLLDAALANLAPCITLFLLKPLVGEAGWPAVRIPALAAFAAAPAAVPGLVPAAGRLRGALEAPLGRLLSSPAGTWVMRALALLMAVFFWFHWVALIEIQSGTVVFERLASWRLPLAAQAPLYIWGAAMLSATLLESFRRLRDGGAGLEAPAALLAVLPAVYAAVFVVFRNTSSIRYYVLPVHLCLAGAAALWPRLARGRASAWAAAAGAAAVLYSLSWAAVLGPADRPPLRFRVGWHKEKSHDFLVKDDLYALARREHVCQLAQDESMLDIPLFFEMTARPVEACASEKRLKTSYCWDCASPPYIKAEVLTVR